MKPLTLKNSPYDFIRMSQHRPWPMPIGRWIWYQEWLDAVFLHWSFNPEVIRPFVPQGLDLDLFEGKAWISIVGFDMIRVHPRGLWPFPGLSNFPEVNIRTYVKRDDKPGVYFLSIEAAHALAVWLACRLSPLPYKKQQIVREQGRLVAGHPRGSRFLDVSYEPGTTIFEKTHRDRWLTERYCLYVDQGAHLFRAEIHHEPWSLQSLHIKSAEIRYLFSEDLHFQRPPDCCHYSRGVPIIAWPHKRLEGETTSY